MPNTVPTGLVIRVRDYEPRQGLLGRPATDPAVVTECRQVAGRWVGECAQHYRSAEKRKVGL